MSDLDVSNHKTEELLSLLREIDKTPEMTQRQLSSKLGISLGKVNFLLRAMIGKGLIKVSNFKKSNNKSAYLYHLTPHGIEQKTIITYHFLKRKLREYEQLEEEIRRLTKEVNDTDFPLEIRDGEIGETSIPSPQTGKL